MQTRGDGESVPSQDDRDSRTQRDAKWRRFRTMEKTELATKLREKPDEADTERKCFMRMGEMDRISKEDGTYGENNRSCFW